MPFFCVFFKFLVKFVFGRVGAVFWAIEGGVKSDLEAGLGVFGVAPSVKRGVSGVRCWGQYPGGGVCGLYLLYGAETSRRETVSGGGLLYDSGVVCLSL